MDPMTLQILIGAAGTVLGWFAKHYLSQPVGPASPSIAPVNPTGPSIDPALAAVLSLLERAIADRVATPKVTL